MINEIDLIMEKRVAAVEFGSKKMKLVVGYELDGQVYVLYSLAKPYGSMIENGEIVDPTRIAEAVREIKNFTDPSAQLKFNISEVLFALPPYGLQIFTSQQITTVVGEDSIINKVDIKNVHNLIRNGDLPSNNVLVDIVPVFYELNQGRRFINPPLGEVSSTVRVAALVHSLPKNVVDSYLSPLRLSEISVKRAMISSYAQSVLLESNPNVPENYILVDIGSNMTTVSLIGEKRLYGSTYFSWGGDKITERIIEVFNINESDAEKYKITYGIDNRVMNFRAPVCKSYDGEGNEIKHYNDELNQIIKDELAFFIKDLNASMDELLKTYDQSTKRLPMILVGGGAKLNGLVEYLSPKVTCDSLTVITPTNLGARDGTYMTCLGLILANSKNQSVSDDSHTRVGKVTRDDK